MFSHYVVKGTIFGGGGIIEHKMCVLNFSTTFEFYSLQLINCRSCNYSLYELLMMGANTRNMLSCLQKYNKLNKSHLVGQLINIFSNYLVKGTILGGRGGGNY